MTYGSYFNFFKRKNSNAILTLIIEKITLYKTLINDIDLYVL